MAVNFKCTPYQESSKKTVFVSLGEAVKSINRSYVNCGLGGYTNFFTFDTKQKMMPLDYIWGLDCSKNRPRIEKFHSFFIQYKKTVKRGKVSYISNAEYMASR